MPKKRNPEDLSVDELRWLLVEKRRAARQERLEHYRRTGRAVVVASDPDATSLQDARASLLPEGEEAATPHSRRRRFLDGFLMVVELGAIIGFLFVVFNGYSLVRTLNQEAAIALEQPTLTPTALIVAVVLPSGHTPPTSLGGARPNDAEIPEHLRAQVQSLANLPVPTPGPEQAVRIQIPAIKVDAPVVQGDGWEELKKGVAQHIGSANPGKKGNVVLSGHNDIFGEVFRYLDKLKPGDEIILLTNQRSYTYLVVDTKIVDPTDVYVMAPTEQPTVTLVSCYPYLVDKQRITVSAKLQNISQ